MDDCPVCQLQLSEGRLDLDISTPGSGTTSSTALLALPLFKPQQELTTDSGMDIEFVHY